LDAFAGAVSGFASPSTFDSEIASVVDSFAPAFFFEEDPKMDALKEENKEEVF